MAGREQLAIEAYAEALEAIRITIAENAGLDPIDIIVELRSKHADPANKWYGVQVKTGKIADDVTRNEPLTKLLVGPTREMALTTLLPLPRRHFAFSAQIEPAPTCVSEKKDNETFGEIR